MCKLDLLLFGYVKLKVDSNFEKVLSNCLVAGVPMLSKGDGVFYTHYKHKSDIVKIFTDCNAKYTILKEYDALNNKEKLPQRIFILIFALFSLLFIIYLSDIVWYIEISGNEVVSDALILSSLEECGFYIGTSWKKADLGKVEIELQSNEPQIAWVSINRNGCIAYVTVIEQESSSELNEKERFTYSNIISKEDCVIEYINVSRGTPVVSVGDVVKKGDLLVLGMKNISGRIEYCAADAEITGRVNKTLSVKVSRKVDLIKAEKVQIISVKIKIFNFCANIFKKYSNLEDECVIIEKKEKLSLFNARPLPVEVIKQYKITSSRMESVVNDNELVESASYQMREMINRVVRDVNLNSIRTFGTFTEQGYIMYSEIVYSCEISENVEFFLDVVK